MNFVEAANAGVPEKDARTECNGQATPSQRSVPLRFKAMESVARGGWIGELDKAAARVLLWMWASANTKTGKVEGGTRLIAAGAGMHRTEVRRGIGKLEDLGLITRLSLGRSRADRSVWRLEIMPANGAHQMCPVEPEKQDTPDVPGSSPNRAQERSKTGHKLCARGTCKVPIAQRNGSARNGAHCVTDAERSLVAHVGSFSGERGGVR